MPLTLMAPAAQVAAVLPILPVTQIFQQWLRELVVQELHQAVPVRAPVVVAAPEIWVPVITVRGVQTRPVAQVGPAQQQDMVVVTEDLVQRPIITAVHLAIIRVAPAVGSVMQFCRLFLHHRAMVERVRQPFSGPVSIRMPQTS